MAFTTGCQSTFYASTYSFNEQYELRNYDLALSKLDNTKLLKKKKRNQVLYYLNHATLSQLMGDYETSIKYFNLADQYISTHNGPSATDVLFTAVANSMKTDYRPETFEQIMLHYYQAINYISIDNYEDAMVECRKMNETLQKLDDYKKDNGKHYTHDAFGHYIMGILYETTGDNNNAYIAYKNALDVYEGDYMTLYGTETPNALKIATARTAYKTGFTQEAKKIENKYHVSGEVHKDKGHLVVFIEDGNSPIKKENLITFLKSGSSASLSFTSEDGSITVPIFFPISPSDNQSLKDINTLTIALPKYEERPSRITPLVYQIDGKTQMAVTVENINRIASQSLKDRYWKELGVALVRAGVKQAVSKTVSKKNEYVGLAIAITQSITEKADTRNWQTLPAQVKIIDMELDEGNHSLKLPNGDVISFDIQANKTHFISVKN